MLAAVAALGSLATQLLVPALPQLAYDLHIDAGDAQLVIGVFLIGLGGGQLLSGPLADRLGRRPVLLTGLGIYCLGSLAAAFAPNLPLLLFGRLIQALGGATGVVVARVLVGDIYPPEETAGKQATLMAVMLVSPALAPALGGLLGELLGWRAILVALAALGLAGFALTLKKLPPDPRSSRPVTSPGLLATVAHLARSPGFTGPVTAIAGGSAALYMFIGNAPFFLAHDHHLRPRLVGAAMMVVATASIAGTRMVARLDRRGYALLTGAIVTLAGGLLLLICALAGLKQLIAFLGPMTVLGLGAGIMMPAGITRVIRVLPGHEGTSASLAGACQMLSGALAAFALSLFAPIDMERLGLGITLACTVSLGGTMLWNRRRRRAV